jgi:hypothetical protein
MYAPGSHKKISTKYLTISSIASSAISGIPIVVKDRGLYLDFMLRVTAEAEDFRETVEDYWRIKQATYR